MSPKEKTGAAETAFAKGHEAGQGKRETGGWILKLISSHLGETQ